MAHSTPGYVEPDAPRWVRLVRLAARQHEVVAWAQLLALGFTRTQISREVAAGRLHRIHRGVYSVGGPPVTVRGRWMAAVLACGSRTVLSHRAAAALWEVRQVPSGPVEVTGRRSRRRPPGVRFHSCRNLHPEDVTVRDAIPVTTLARTLLDLAEVLHPQWLLRALEAAERSERLDWQSLEATLERGYGRHGRPALRQAMAELTGSPPWTQSQLEEAFLVLIRRSRLPEPQCNVLVHGVLVDCFWPQAPLAVELDGFRYHRGRRSFEEDRRKDVKLQLAGIPVLRFTQPRVEHEAAQVAAEVEAMVRRSLGR